MYRIVKTQGNNANVVVENTDTKANVIIGRISIEMLNILEKAGHKISSRPGESGISMTSAWNIPVDTETASALSKMTMKMKKPIRDQRKSETKKEANKKIDAMDVMLGLANYSQKGDE